MDVAFVPKYGQIRGFLKHSFKKFVFYQILKINQARHSMFNYLVCLLIAC